MASFFKLLFSPFLVLLVMGGGRPVNNAVAQGPGTGFEAQTIDGQVSIGYGVAVGDVDGDGRPDILLADQKAFVWYRNPDWSKFVIAENITPRDNVCLAARDLDGDGKVEVAVGANWNPSETSDPEKSGSVHFLSRPEQSEEEWTPSRLPHEPTVHRMQWVRGTGSAWDLIVAPLHGVDNRDGQGKGVRVLAYRFPQDSSRSWPISLVEDSMHITHNFDVVAWDEDAEEELLLAGREGIVLLDRAGDKWAKTVISSHPTGAGEVRAGRLTSGKRFICSVEPWHGNQLAVYMPTSGAGVWQRIEIDETLAEGHALATGDLLGLGRDQIVVGWRKPNADGRVGIKLFVPNADGTRWQSQLVDDNRMACEDLRIADLNDDGRPDIVAAGRATRNLVIYWNRNEPEN